MLNLKKQLSNINNLQNKNEKIIGYEKEIQTKYKEALNIIPNQNNKESD